MAQEWLEASPEQVSARLRREGVRRAWMAWDEADGLARASTPLLEPLAAHLARHEPDHAGHRAIFLQPGPRTGSLFAVSIHSCLRGQAQGGVRYIPYPTLAGMLRDALRLSLGMGRKSALAGLWWGGGKGVIARSPGEEWREPARRRALFAAWGRFVSSLHGCYVTGEDAGTTPLDMAEVARHTRFATCVPPEVGGSGNPSSMTALGVVEAMEAALEHRAERTLAGCRVAMQGAGQVGAAMIERLFEKGVARIVVAEVDAARADALREFFAGRPLEVRSVLPGDDSILAEPCDVFVPNALGGTLSAKTIPMIAAGVVCGAANNQLADPARDASRLCERRITWVPDYVANRMGIVHCCDEHAGHLPRDPAVLAHLDRTNPASIHATTLRVLARARARGESAAHAADALADAAMREPHPLHGDRAERIVRSLLEHPTA